MRLASLIFALTLCACSGGDDAERDREGPFDDMTGTIDKAGEVEKQVLERKDELDAALEQAGNTDDERDP